MKIPFSTRVLLCTSLLLSLTLTGCFAKLQHLPPHPQQAGPVFAPVSNKPVLVGLAISGGGSRAATFAAGVLEALAHYRITQHEQPTSLLETVTHISSVSGGSLATAYYALNKPSADTPVLSPTGLTPAHATFFDQFKKDMQMNFELRALGRQLLNFRVLNPTKAAYSFAEVWDTHFFHHRTFSDLYERERRHDIPRIILNGTLYNSGHRVALTSLSSQDFQYHFVSPLDKDLAERVGAKQLSEEGRSLIRKDLDEANDAILPLTMDRLGMQHQSLPISLAVATSASFPPVVGPVTYQATDGGPYYHIGDGGLYDNLGTESLMTLFLSQLTGTVAKQGLIIVIDAAFPFDVGESDLDKNEKGFQVFTDDPSRIVGIMEERANAYQMMLWNSLRAKGVVLPDFRQLRLVRLKYTDAEWTGYADLPTECQREFPLDVKPIAIKEMVRHIPTTFAIKNDCHAALLFKAAQKVVNQKRPFFDRFFNPQPAS